MRVEVVPMWGLKLRALIIEEGDESQPCENCGKPRWQHEDLAKEDVDWCMNCNDEQNRAHMTDTELSMWTIDQHNKGKIVMVVTGSE